MTQKPAWALVAKPEALPPPAAYINAASGARCPTQRCTAFLTFSDTGWFLGACSTPDRPSAL